MVAEITWDARVVSCDFECLYLQEVLTELIIWVHNYIYIFSPVNFSHHCVFTFATGACFGLTRISVGKANKRLTYTDQVLQLVYEDGSPCPSKSGLSYKSVISFVCRPEAGPTNRPLLISLDKQTCALFFAWHTPLACEQVVSRGGHLWHLRSVCLSLGTPKAWVVAPYQLYSVQFIHAPLVDTPSISCTPDGFNGNWLKSAQGHVTRHSGTFIHPLCFFWSSFSVLVGDFMVIRKTLL